MRITYLGQCGFLIEEDGICVATDPYLSYTVDKKHRTEETPWVRAYAPPVAPEDLSCDLVLISHSHDDHMDPETLPRMRQGGCAAPVCCPAPELGKLAGMINGDLVPLRAGISYSLAGVTVTPIPCAHTELHRDENGDYRELSYLIAFPGGKRVFFGGDMSLYPGLIDAIRALSPDILLLPANGRSEELTRKGIIGNLYAEEAAALAKALDRPYIPMHHDLYPFNGCPNEHVLAAAADIGARVRLPAPGGTLAF